MSSLKFLLAVVSCLGPALAAPTPTTDFNKRADDVRFHYFPHLANLHADIQRPLSVSPA